MAFDYHEVAARVSRIPSAPVIGDRFEIQGLAGRGASGSVYRATDTATGATVALKILSPLATSDVARFEREAAVLSEIHHPGVVRHVASGVTPSGVAYLAMEWLEGHDLRHRHAAGPMSIEDSVRLGIRVAEALYAVHARGFVHRDLKPSNLFLRDDSVDRVAVVDFGVAHAGRGAPFPIPEVGPVGTPSTMAPEQARGDPDIDGRADLFALGCVLYTCITGHAPFGANNIMAVLAKILFEETPRVREIVPEVSEALDDLVASLMAKERDMRPATASAALALLREIEKGPTTGTRPPAAAAPINITGLERRFCSVIAALPPATHRSATGSLDEADEGGPGSLASLFASFQARFEILRDGVVVALVSGGESATDQAMLAARCALSLRARWRGARVSLATGPGTIGSRLPVGQVIDRASHVLLLRSAGGPVQVARAHFLPRRSEATGPTSSPGVHAIAIDEVTAALLDARFDVVASGPGAGDRVLGLRGERSASDGRRTLLGKSTPCVGRARELALLASVFDECATDQVARVVIVTAPPGFGKSRLRYELLDQLRAQGRQIEVWMGRGDVMSPGSPLGMLAQAIRSAAGVLDGEPLASRRKKLAARVARHVEPASRARVAEFLGELVGAPFPEEQASVQLRAARRNPRAMGDQMRRAWTDFVTAEGATRPVLLILEDLHWGDAATVSFVDDALRACRDRPLLVLALARPNLGELFDGLWATSNPLTIALRELSLRESELLVVHVLGDSLSQEAVSEIAATSQGNAFYLEELIRSAAEGDPGRPPRTVVAMVQARLLRFDDDVRRILRAASVYGQAFWTGGVRALLGASDAAARLDSALDLLVGREVISRRAESKFPLETEYTFRHALVRDAAYAMLTVADQTLGHRLASEWLEQSGEHDAMTLAEHHERGGEPGRAARWFERAAEQALEGSDLPAAIARAERGVASCPPGPDQGRLLALQTEAHFWTADYAAAEARGTLALPWLERGSGRWCRTLARTAVGRARRGDADATLKLVETLLEVEALGDAEDPGALVFALAQVANQLLFLGRHELLLRVCDRVEAIATKQGTSDPTLAAWVAETLAARAMVLGDIGTAIELMESASRHFLAAGDMRESYVEAISVGYGYCTVGMFDDAARVLREVAPIIDRLRLLHLKASVAQNLGVAVALGGARDEGHAILRGGLETCIAIGDPRLEGATRLHLAILAADLGNLDEAEALCRSAVALGQDTPGVRAPALAELAVVLVARGRGDEALAAATQAHELLVRHVSLEFGDVLVRLAFAEALHATGKFDAARAQIVHARDLLVAQADRIRDPRRRASFLANVPENARTLKLAEDWGGVARP